MNIRNWPGQAERPALALHCMMGSGGYWGRIAAELSDIVQITAPDLPGHGQSPDWQPGTVDFHTTVTREVASLIQRPLDLIGHSMGATVALRIAIAAPEAVRSLTLIEPVLFAAAPHPESAEELAELDRILREGRDEDAARHFLGIWGDVDLDSQSAAGRARLIRQIGLVSDSNDTLVHDRANMLRDGGLEGIDAPVMLIMGGDSPAVIPEIADALAARLPDVARATVPNAGHMLPITHPDQVAGLIRMNLERG